MLGMLLSADFAARLLVDIYIVYTEVIGAAPGSNSVIDWHQTWLDSPERVQVRSELEQLKAKRPQETQPATNPGDKASYRPFAASGMTQAKEITKRTFQQYWRTPSYIFAKAFIVTASVRESEKHLGCTTLIPCVRVFLSAFPSITVQSHSKAFKISCRYSVLNKDL